MKKIFLIGLISLFITGCGCAKSDTKDNKTELDKNGVSKEEVIVKEITFNDIKLEYDGGITNLKATIKNTTDKVKNIKVSIILKDDNNKEIKKLTQVIENIETDSDKKLQVGIVGDYSNIKNVEFRIEEEF